MTNDLNVCMRVNYAYAGFVGVFLPAVGDSVAQGYGYTIEQTTRVTIDPNVRVRGNGTYAGFEDVTGPIAVGDLVEVYEAESSLVGQGRVTEIDVEPELVYLSVDWSSLADEAITQSPSAGAVEGRVLSVPEPAVSICDEPAWMRLAARPSLAYLTPADAAM